MTHEIHVVQLELKPASGSEWAHEATGAFANVYVRAINERTAVSQAREEVESEGWLVEEVTESIVVTAESFEGGEGLEYFKQCESDGVVVVLHTWRDAQ